MNFGSVEVFDFLFTDKEGYKLFEIKSAKENCFTRFPKIGESLLIIEDALIDSEVFFDMMNGAYDNQSFDICGDSIWRNTDEGSDYTVVCCIKDCKLNKYTLLNRCDGLSRVKLAFEYKEDTLNSYVVKK